jgi:hypothetical protein
MSTRARTHGLRVPARVLGILGARTLEQLAKVVVPAERDRSADRQLTGATSCGGRAPRDLGELIERALVVVGDVQQRPGDHLDHRVAARMCERGVDVGARLLELPSLGQEARTQEPRERVWTGEQVPRQRRVEAAGLELGGEALGWAQR